MIVFRRLLDAQPTAAARLGLLASKIEDHFATVFRQIAMHNFEFRAHQARREEGELSSDRLSELWFQANGEMFDGSVTLRDDYRIWWSYIPHFIGSPFYVHAYAYGDLLVLGSLAALPGARRLPSSRATSKCCQRAAQSAPTRCSNRSASTWPTRPSGTAACASWATW